jgi:hypothetical protein
VQFVSNVARLQRRAIRRIKSIRNHSGQALQKQVTRHKSQNTSQTRRTCTGGPSNAGDCDEGLGFSNLRGITRRTIHSATADVEGTQAATRAHTYREEWLRAAACCCCMSTSMTTVLQRNYFSRDGDEFDEVALLELAMRVKPAPILRCPWREERGV